MLAGKKVTVILAIVIFLALMIGVAIFRSKPTAEEPVITSEATTRASAPTPHNTQAIDPAITKNRRALDSLFNTK